MSEKRFTIKPQDGYWAVVDNYNTVRIINGVHTDIEYDKVCIINGIHTEIEAVWLCDFMNEQHSIICRDEISIKTMMFNMEKLEEENEKLKNDFHFLKEIHQEGSKSCEKWKQYKEAQIQQLEKENEQLRKDKEILKERLRECRIKMDKFNCR